ncbi:MAG TPA: glucose-6-phosphate isomerase [Pseudomonadales bacterium]|jgi:glucose-6-phosphate isomerase
MRPDDLAPWKSLTRLSADSIKQPLSDWLRSPERFARLSFEVGELLVDLSKQRLNEEIVDALLALAGAARLDRRIDDLFEGAQVNPTEQRPALHTALRAPLASRPAAYGEAVETTLTRMLDFAERVRSGVWRGATGKAIKSVVHIGIGGSHLGPELAVRALEGAKGAGPSVRFVANIDRSALDTALTGLDPETTLFIVASKSFTTLETRVNADSARAWFLERMADLDALKHHFVAITENVEAARAFGMGPEQIFPMWDWVGGRYSLWSAVGLPVAISAGADAFRELLAGAHAMDEHFRSSPLSGNVPVLMALAGVWNYNFLGVSNHAILPYSARLGLLPSYLQQLEMESNGKSVDLEGEAVTVHTAPIIWGGEGTNGQHAFHQLLHQGTRSFTADFIMVGQPDPDDVHGRWLLANGLAQSQAMMAGQDADDAHRRVAGDHATTTIVMRQLNPFSLGSLLALYEHKVFCQGVIWNINSFDQFGVELGKTLSVPIFQQLGGNSAMTQDASTRGLVELLRGTTG